MGKYGGITGQYFQHTWKCCGKARGKAAFCPECGQARPAINDPSELLEFFQKERDKAEQLASDHRAKREKAVAVKQSLSALRKHCFEITTEQFFAEAGENVKIAHALSDAKRWVEKPLEELTERRYDRESGRSTEQIFDEEHLLASFDLTQIMVDLWSAIKPGEKVEIARRVLQAELGCIEVPEAELKKFVALNNPEEFSRLASEIIVWQYRPWILDRLWASSRVLKLRFLTVAALRRNEERADQEIMSREKSITTAEHRAETFSRWTEIVGGLMRKIEELTAAASETESHGS